VAIYKKVGKQIEVIIKACHCYRLNTAIHSILFCQGQLHMQTKSFGIISVDINVSDQPWIIYSVFIQNPRKFGNKWGCTSVPYWLQEILLVS